MAGKIKPGMPSNVPGANPETEKVTTIEPTKKKSTLLKDLNTAIMGTASGGPQNQVVQERTKVAEEAAKQGVDPNVALYGVNTPVHADQVEDWKENPLDFNPTPTAEKTTTETIGATGTQNGNAVVPEDKNFQVGNKTNIDTAGDYNVGANDVASIEQGGEDTYKIAKDILDSNNPYKSGADYVKYLWSQGATGKARAVANVLGNILGNAGQSLTGDTKGTQWNDFVNTYQKQEREARETAMKDAQDAIKTANANQAARTELVKALNQAKAQGANLSAKDMAAIEAWQKATHPSSTLDKALAVILNKVGGLSALGL